MQQPANKGLPNDCHSCHPSLKFATFEVKDERPNNCIITKSNNVVVIKRICKKNDEIVIIGREFLQKYDIPYYLHQRWVFTK